MPPPKVGTIRGRHLMPVDLFLIDRVVAPGQEAYTETYLAAFRHGHTLSPGSEVHLYYTGLTETTIGAVDGYEASGVNVVLYRFDTPTGKYVPFFRSSTRKLYRCGGHACRVDEHCPTCGKYMSKLPLSLQPAGDM